MNTAAVREFADVGFTDIAVVQVGGQSQPNFLDWAERVLIQRYGTDRAQASSCRSRTR